MADGSSERLGDMLLGFFIIGRRPKSVFRHPERRLQTYYIRQQSWNRVTGHRVNDYVRVGSGLGSKLFTYRPGIVTRLLTEQENDTA